EPTPFVTYINYNAKGQREIIEYGNGAHTRYTYDRLTFRMTRLLTIRKQDHARLQDLNYTFDPVGNITSIRDDAQETIYFRNHVVSPSNEYVYDAIYRLISADGREHAGRPGQPQTTFDDSPRMHQPLPSDGHALHRYLEQYEYDGVGNILRILHSAADGNWSRFYTYDERHAHPTNNRLTSTRVGRDEEHYAYDAAGNMTRMPHLPGMDWDFKDQLHATRRQEKNAGRGETTYYVYDSAGQRVRKVTERASGSREHERIYLGGFEAYREYDSVGATTLERETLHVMDGKRRVALVETKTIDAEVPVTVAAPLARVQLDNHLGSAVLEIDDEAAIVSYEEYYPYGSTSFQAGRSLAEVGLKRYRYTGKERDEETGFYYNGARYCPPWLGRWLNCDPMDASGGQQLYVFVHDNPVVRIDPDGAWDEPVATPAPAAAASPPPPPVPGSTDEAFAKGLRSGIQYGNKAAWAEHVLDQLKNGLVGEGGVWNRMSPADKALFLNNVLSELGKLPAPPEYEDRERSEAAERGFRLGLGRGRDQAAAEVFALWATTQIALAAVSEAALRLPLPEEAPTTAGATGVRAGGQILRSEAELYRAAESAYSSIRSAGTDQLATVAKNTGFGESTLTDIYHHVFTEQHEIAVGPGKTVTKLFEADPEIATLWKKAQGGPLEGADLTRFRELMAHEGVEMRLMREGLPYRSSSPEAWTGKEVNGTMQYEYRATAGAYGAHDIAPKADPIFGGPLGHWIRLAVIGQ
ncbi:MAG TPA: RHS repeat-associated core domain-containing protein, partial [Isosphaeraceae bacterium]|nr:RHS repeat-associated core domain-containing protein [Isosphaeraceae bacterium]